MPFLIIAISNSSLPGLERHDRLIVEDPLPQAKLIVRRRNEAERELGAIKTVYVNITEPDGLMTFTALAVIAQKTFVLTIIAQTVANKDDKACDINVVRTAPNVNQTHAALPPTMVSYSAHGTIIDSPTGRLSGTRTAQDRLRAQGMVNFIIDKINQGTITAPLHHDPFAEGDEFILDQVITADPSRDRWGELRKNDRIMENTDGVKRCRIQSLAGDRFRYWYLVFATEHHAEDTQNQVDTTNDSHPHTLVVEQYPQTPPAPGSSRLNFYFRFIGLEDITTCTELRTYIESLPPDTSTWEGLMEFFDNHNEIVNRVLSHLQGSGGGYINI